MASNSVESRSASFFDDLVRCETRLYNAVGEALRAEHGITTVQFELLRYLRDHPRARVADAASNFASGLGATSKLADRLAERGWIIRTPNPADGRSSLLSLTRIATSLVDAAERTFTARLAELIGAALDADQVVVVSRALAALRSSLEDARAGLPTG